MMPGPAGLGYHARVLARLTLLAERHRLLVDVLAATVVTAVSLALAHQPQPPGTRSMDALGYALTVVVNLSLAARRRAPLVVLGLYVTLWTAYVEAGYWPVVNSSGAMYALYTVAASRSTRVTGGAAALFAAVWVFAGWRGGQDALWTAVAQSVGWSGVIWRVGYTTRQLAERNRQLALFTVELGRQQEERAQRAVTEERVRIARELHDVVAHHMSVVSVQAGLAEYVLDADRATARTALQTAQQASTEALQEMRRMLSLLSAELHEDGDGSDPTARPYDPAPGLDRLDDLVGRVRAAGVPVEVIVGGVRRPLAPGVDLCAYRVVQECLTNVIKHAPGARTTVMDIRMPDVDGVEATQRILTAVDGYRPRILMLTTFDLDEYVYAALRAGASGFLLKDTPPDRLIAAIRVIAAGDMLFAPSVTRRLIESYTDRARSAADLPELDGLTTRETEVLRLVGQGLTNTDIAGRLTVGEATVKTHLNRAMAKLDLSSRAQAVVMAYESGLVAPAAKIARTARRA